MSTQAYNINSNNILDLGNNIQREIEKKEGVYNFGDTHRAEDKEKGYRRGAKSNLNNHSTRERNNHRRSAIRKARFQTSHLKSIDNQFDIEA